MFYKHCRTSTGLVEVIRAEGAGNGRRGARQAPARHARSRSDGRAAGGGRAAEPGAGARAAGGPPAGGPVLQHGGDHRVPAAREGPAGARADRAGLRVPAGRQRQPGRQPDEPGSPGRYRPRGGAQPVRVRVVRPRCPPAAPTARRGRGPAGMNALVYLPLLVPVLAAAAARPLAARLEPRLATWLLTATMVALAAFSTAALALLAASALARVPFLAALGNYSQPALRSGDPVPAVAGSAAALLLTAVAIAVAVVIRARARALAESYRRAARMAPAAVS